MTADMRESLQPDGAASEASTRRPSPAPVSAGLPIAPKPLVRRFHQASWDEPIIFELSVPGARGVLPPAIEPAITEVVGNPAAELEPGIGRLAPPALPELSQVHVVRHYGRLSQENLGADLNVDVGQGTCTMKYSPKVNDQLVRSPKVADTHPAQDPSTVQGTLEILWRLERALAEISGMERVSLQPASGSAAIWTNVAMIRAYHTERGEGPKAPVARRRDEVVTTLFSHPSNAAAAKVAGYRVVTLHPDADGYPDLAALRAAVGPRTAALLITNPEDTGIFNPRIEEYVRVVHDAGGLCAYDQANANGILGITRARDAGFDACHFNIHKTFSTPHASGGPGAAAVAVAPHLVPFLPSPTIERDADGRFWLDSDRPLSIGKVRPWYGNVPNLVRAYAWIMSLGAEGLREVAEVAVLNNNYLMQKVLAVRGASAPYARGRRIEQVRYSWDELSRDTGVHTDDIGRRVADFGTHYWTSHHPHVVPEPMTLEPTESYSRGDLDEYAAILSEVAREAYEEPETVLTAPHRSTVHRVDHAPLDDPERWAVTWRAYRRKHLRS